MGDTSTQIFFKSLEDLYQEGSSDALIELILLNKNQFDQGLFHYNLGSIYASKDMFGISRYHLEKSIKSGFLNPLSINNLEYVKSKISVIDHSNSWRDDFIYGALFIPSSLYLSMTLLLVSLGVLRVRFTKKISFKKSILWTMISLIPWSINHFYFEKISMAIVLKEGRIYEGPSKIYASKRIAPEGVAFIVSEVYKDWLFIKYPQSLTGWIKREELGFL